MQQIVDEQVGVGSAISGFVEVASSRRDGPVPPPPKVGTTVSGKYRIDAVIGKGGMGVVLGAQHLHLDRAVAMKFLLPEGSEYPGAVSRFLREARACARIQSEHVARVLDVGTLDDGAPFMVMERLTGTDLHHIVRNQGPLAIDVAIEYVLQACVALAEAHALGIVHRDLKPSNLFLTRRVDGTPLVKLLDFGIAKAPEAQAWSEGNLTVAHGTMGSPLYMSPEHLRDTSSVDLRTDIWSLGIILHELLTNRYPFEAASPAQLGAVIATAKPIPLRAHFPTAPEGLEAVVLKCLEKEVSKRFQSVGELATALQPFANDRSKLSLDRISTLCLALGDNQTALAVPRPSNRPPAPVVVDAPAPVSAPTPSSRSITGSRSPTDNFRRQHEELTALGQEIMGHLRIDELAANASTVRRLMARFAGKLTVHASMENEALYPRLLAHSDPAVRDRARTLFEDVKKLYGIFGTYTKRWPTAASIEAEPAAFCEDTMKVFYTLAKRMHRENKELYPMVDAAG